MMYDVVVGKHTGDQSGVDELQDEDVSLARVVWCLLVWDVGCCMEDQRTRTGEPLLLTGYVFQCSVGRAIGAIW